jgi:hypothetical protein
MLGKLVEQGEGRIPICVDKETFKDNRESDGCTILEVDGLRVALIHLADDDGGTAVTKAGLERTRRMAVLYGTSYDPTPR